MVKSYFIHFTGAEDGVNEIILHVANYYGLPEIIKSLKIGSEAAIDSEWMGAIGTQLVMIFIFVLHGLYALIIYIFNRNRSLRNTERRLKQRYGKGLLVQSELGVGTTVTFTIPIG